jgi:hypothetical protein
MKTRSAIAASLLACLQATVAEPKPVAEFSPEEFR